MLQRALCCLVVVGLSFFPSYAAEPKRGGSIRVGIHTNPGSLNPFLGHTQDRWVRSLMYEGILGQNKDLDPMPGLVSAWNIASDGLTDGLSDEQIQEILSRGDCNAACNRLMEGAMEAGGRDNITVIVADVDIEDAL